MKNKDKITPLVFSILIAQLAGIIGSLFTAPNIAPWYAALVKPGFTPPGWLFGPVWVTLYTLMGLAAYLVWRGRKNPHTGFSLWFYGVHLIINLLWSVIFFGLHDIAMAFLVIITLWLMILGLIILFWRINKMAAYLLVPYLAWVSYASVLNAALWLLN